VTDLFDYEYQPFASKRMPVVARNGMVATAQPLAAEAGLEILRQGGNAVDAAVATAACLSVVEPTTNGIGSDCFAIIWMKGKLYGLNASGVAPQSISVDKLKKAGFDQMPTYGWEPVMVPGTPAGWAACSKRFGKLPLTQVLAPAIKYAEEGYPLSPQLAKLWRNASRKFKKAFHGPLFDEWFRVFNPNGEIPTAGEMWRSPDHAKTLQEIAETGADSFYHGRLAKLISDYVAKTGGYLSSEDLDQYEAEWIKPLSVDYKGYDVWELPPNGQGMVTLMALNILKNLDFPTPDPVENLHRQIEAIKLAFADGKQYITDPRDMGDQVAAMLKPEYGQKRAKLISQTALQPEPGRLPKGGTVYLCTADGEGNMVSWIQSNYMGFGSGVVVPDTGIALQNRGETFSFNPEDANVLVPGKRTYHTIMPGFLTKNSQAVGPFGVMGGYMQPQGHLQVVTNLIDFNLNPQATLDAPRWQWLEDKKVLVEKSLPQPLAEALQRRGHEISVDLSGGAFGRGQVILRNPGTGVLVGGTEPRADGNVVGF